MFVGFLRPRESIHVSAAVSDLNKIKKITLNELSLTSRPNWISFLEFLFRNLQVSGWKFKQKSFVTHAVAGSSSHVVPSSRRPATFLPLGSIKMSTPMTSSQNLRTVDFSFVGAATGAQCPHCLK